MRLQSPNQQVLLDGLSHVPEPLVIYNYYTVSRLRVRAALKLGCYLMSKRIEFLKAPLMFQLRILHGLDRTQDLVVPDGPEGEVLGRTSTRRDLDS